MTAARPRLASVLLLVARWSTNLNVIFITSDVRRTAMIEDESIRSFFHKIKSTNNDIKEFTLTQSNQITSYIRIGWI